MIILLLLSLLISTNSFADVYVVTKQDNSVYSISEEDDAVVPDGYNKFIINDKYIKDLSIDMSKSQLYDFKDNGFVFNPTRLAEFQKEQQDAIIALQKRIDAKKTAQAKLKALGLSDDEVSALVK